VRASGTPQTNPLGRVFVFQPSLRDGNHWARLPGVETPGYSQASLRDAYTIRRLKLAGRLQSLDYFYYAAVASSIIRLIAKLLENEWSGVS